MQNRALICQGRAEGAAGQCFGVVATARRFLLLVLVSAAFAGAGEEPAEGVWTHRLTAEEDESASAEALAARAAQGDHAAEYHLGRMYLKGTGVKQDARQAEEFLRRAAGSGLVDAYAWLGMALFSKNDRRKWEEGLLWMRKGVADGDPFAEYMYAVSLLFMYGDDRCGEAVRLLEHAASRGITEAKFKLAFFYSRGRCVARQRSRAIALYKDLAGAGEIRAFEELARIYGSEDSGRDDLVEAVKWWILAHPNEPVKGVPPEVEQEARRAAARWREQHRETRREGGGKIDE